jgi:Protein of unknown function (DUF3489)
MPKLTDAQLVILSNAAQRASGAALPLPKSLKIRGAAVSKTFDALRKRGLLQEQPAPHDAIAWREGKDGGRMMLVITAAGLKVLDGESAAEQPKSSLARSTAKKARAETRVVSSQALKRKQTTDRTGSKQSLLIDLLKHEGGASIDEIVAATGWQAHSVRGAISGTLKKKLGLVVASEKSADRGRVYRIAKRDRLNQSGR